MLAGILATKRTHDDPLKTAHAMARCAQANFAVFASDEPLYKLARQQLDDAIAILSTLAVKRRRESADA